MSSNIFHSPLALRLQAFFDTRQTLGRKGQVDRKILKYLDRFLTKTLKPGQPITRELVQLWVEQMQHLSLGTRINRICMLRQFCIYLSHFDPRTYIVEPRFLPSRVRSFPHIYTKQEVCSIIAAARKVGPRGSLRSEVISTLIGLLYATGLRIGEALKLTLSDVNLKQGLLIIRQTKFDKSRYVPLSSSTVHQLNSFLDKRKKAGFSIRSTAPVFVNPNGQSYGPTTVYTVFLEIVRSLKLRGPKGERGPRIHDFRHTFAVNRLAAWYKQGSDLSSKLPLLATYLGHSTMTCTGTYLHATAELLEKTNRRFHNHFMIPSFIHEEDNHVKNN